jgi:hypothetical protein
MEIKTPKPWTFFANWFYNEVDKRPQQNDLSKQWTYCAFQLWNVFIGLNNCFQVKMYIKPIRLRQFLSNFDVKNFVHCIIPFTITCYCSSHWQNEYLIFKKINMFEDFLNIIFSWSTIVNYDIVIWIVKLFKS